MNNSGITLVQLIVAVAVLVILAAATFTWIDPLARIGVAKDEARRQDVGTLTRAIQDYVNDHQGALPVLGSVTTDKKTLCEVQGASNVSCGGSNVHCLRIAHEDFYNDYLAELPIDPDKTNNKDTGYYLQKDSNGRLVIGACSTYGSEAITQSTTINVSCDAYAGGHCWYLGGEEENCNTTCSNEGLDCIPWTRYAEDVDSGSQCYGALHRSFVSALCDGECDLVDDNWPPMVMDDGNECYYQTDPIDCSQNITGQGYLTICPCE